MFDSQTSPTRQAARVGFAQVADRAWDNAETRYRTPMQSHLWARAYAATLAQGEIDVVIVGDPSAPRALAAFARSASGTRRWTLLGAEDLWESIEVAAQDAEAEEVLVRRLARSSRALRFGHYPANSGFLQAMTRAARGRALFVRHTVPGRAMPRIALGPQWCAPESQLSSRRRSDLRRMGRLASESGKVSYEILSPGRAEVDSLVLEAFAVEEKNWKGRSGTAMASDAAKGAFYKEYARLAAEAGILRLCFLRIDGAPAAMQFAVECDNAFWLLKIGYDETYRRCSPGNLLMRETISYAATKGLAAYEFLGREADWTKLWTTEARPIVNARLYPYNASGAWTLLADMIELATRRLGARFSRTPQNTAA